MMVSIISIDYDSPSEYWKLPIEAHIIREVPGPDKEIYYIAKLAETMEKTLKGEICKISYLVLTNRFNKAILPGMARITVGIALVTDESLVNDDILNFAKCYYAAVGEAKVSYCIK